MPSQIALLFYTALVVYLVRNANPTKWSRTLWLPLSWLLIIATKTPAMWLAIITGGGRAAEGSLLDTVILLAMLVAAIWILIKRKAAWSKIFRRNRWLFLFFGFELLSLLWSDQPVASLKLWIKDIGTLVMVLLILSEGDPAESVKVLMLRASYILIPLSMLLVKYYPEIGRGYDAFTYKPVIIGASESKNALGAVLLVAGLGLMINAVGAKLRLKVTLKLASQVVVCLMLLWILPRSNCATALGGLTGGALILIGLRSHLARHLLGGMGMTALLIIPVMLMALDFLFGISEIFVGGLGRDMTLTARTDIWQASLAAQANSFVGAGYFSFWNQQGHAISDRLGFFFQLKEAHNGYIETYLNNGLIGLGLLIIALFTGLRRVLAQVKTSDYGAVRLVFIVVALIYNISESAFGGLNIIWFSLLIALTEYPRRRRSVTAAPARPEKISRRRAANQPLPEPAVRSMGSGYGYCLSS